ncbi:MAG: alpha-L-fucosidase [Verrucomicrobiae bacterium]|nr:alpha-L-fucosidase [Verrucomicrobiae bacterium]
MISPILAATLLASAIGAPASETPIAGGPFKPTDESLKQYRCPEWFRDAKFGIWSHWGPQAVPRQGDWYARRMYEGEDHPDRKTGKPVAKADPAYLHHLQNYGHPSKFGYKDIIPLWKAERWEPAQLMALYKKAGARYFVSMGTHHDNFFLWDSKIHRWNSVRMGPKKDVVKLWQQAARKEGLRFGVSEHLGASFTWFQASHGADAKGPMAGVPYDGNDPANQDLYHGKAAPDDRGWLTKNPDWQRQWFRSIKELVDGYQPDLLYSDSPMPFGDIGRSLIAHLYNQRAAEKGGDADVVYTCKEESAGRWVRDIERGVAEGISPEPWQTDTSIGDWYYRTGQKYRTAKEIVQMLADIVSKNGNLLINIVQTPEGDLEPDMIRTLEEIGAWIAVNGEGIYSTRPWKVYGEGPSTRAQGQEKGRFGGLKDVPDKGYTAADIRFTASKDGGTVYAFCLEAPGAPFRIGSMAGEKIASVTLLGHRGKVTWKQDAEGLMIDPVGPWPAGYAVAFKIALAR